MALRRIAPEVLQVNLGPVRMWRDDLAKIARIIQECASSGAVMTADGYELDDVDDLLDLAEREVFQVEEFSIASLDGRVQLRLGRAVSLLEIQEPDLKAKGAVTEIKEVSNRCRNYANSIQFRQAVRILAAAIPLFGRSLLNATDKRLDEVPSQAIIYTRSRVEAPTFWQQKKHDVLITVVSNIFSLLLGGVIGYYVNKIS